MPRLLSSEPATGPYRHFFQKDFCYCLWRYVRYDVDYTTLFAAARTFVDHDISFKAATRLLFADALFPSIEQDGTT